MTLIEAVLISTECKDLSELKSLPKEKKLKLASAFGKLKAEQASLDDWNAILASFGEKAKKTPDRAYARLIDVLTTDSELEQVEDSEPIPHKNHIEKNKSKSAFMRVWNIVTTVFVAVTVVLAVALVGVRILGIQVYTVLSGSMEPEYHVGALIYVKKVDSTELSVGDDITFMLDEDTVATHRIVGIVPDENDPSILRFRTKGVANEHEDGTLVHHKNIVGKPIFTIPYLGYIANFIQHPPGTYIAVCAGALLIFLVFVPDLFSEKDKNDKKRDEAKASKS